MANITVIQNAVRYLDNNGQYHVFDAIKGDQGEPGGTMSQAQMIDLVNQTMQANYAYVARYHVTFASNAWTLSSNRYTQTVELSGLNYSESQDAQCDIDMSNATSGLILDEWAKIGRIYLDSSGLHAVCYGSCPIMDIPIVLRITGGTINENYLSWANEESF